MTSLRSYMNVPFSLAATIALAAVLAIGFSSVPQANAISNGRLAFQSSLPGGEDQIWTMNLDGSGRKQITNSTYNNEMGSWSRDGKKLAIDRNLSDTHNYVVIVMNADGTGEHQLTDTGEDYTPSWSPDGMKIAFTTGRDGDREIYMMNANGSNPVNLTNSPDWDSDASWSPDGAKIAFRSSRDGNDEIYVMDANGSHQTRLTNNPEFDGEPQWSPDSATIVWQRYSQTGSDVYAIDLATKMETQLTFTDRAYDPSYAPDGSLIAIEQSDGLYTMKPDGSEITKIPNTTSADEFPAWQPLTLHAGDTDCDGQVQAQDALPPLLKLAGTPNDAGCVAAANVKCDDALTLADVLLILRHADGLTADLPQGCAAFGAEITSNTNTATPSATSTPTAEPSSTPTSTTTASATHTPTPTPSPVVTASPTPFVPPVANGWCWMALVSNGLVNGFDNASCFPALGPSYSCSSIGILFDCSRGYIDYSDYDCTIISFLADCNASSFGWSNYSCTAIGSFVDCNANDFDFPDYNCDVISGSFVSCTTSSSDWPSFSCVNTLATYSCT